MIIDVLDARDLDWKSAGPNDPVAKEKRALREWIEGVRRAGGKPIIVHGMCNAIGHVVRQVIQRAGGFGKITLLRFHGHGATGWMGLASGKWSPGMSKHLSDFGPNRRRAAGNTLADLAFYFAKNGHVELHGCSVAKGPAGRDLILWLAKSLGVPVAAGVRPQIDSGDPSDTYRFEGPVLTAYPSGVIKRTTWRNAPSSVCGF